jgi:hypothetical protein
MEDTIIEVPAHEVPKTLVVKEINERWEAHQDGRLFASWPDEISARVKLLEFVFKGFRVIWP